jgi:hypothetical protein
LKTTYHAHLLNATLMSLRFSSSARGVQDDHEILLRVDEDCFEKLPETVVEVVHLSPLVDLREVVVAVLADLDKVLRASSS